MANQNSNKSRTVSTLTGLLILAIGVVLIICNKLITGQGIIVLAGVLFLLTGIINIALYVTRRDAEGKRIRSGMSLFLGWLVSIAAILLGLCMLVFTSTFNAMIPFIFGSLIFLGSLMLIFTFIFGVRKIVVLPAWVWLFPFAMIVLGVVIITRNPIHDDPLIMILTGVAMIIFGITGIIVGIIVASVKRNMRHAALQSDNTTETVKATPANAQLTEKSSESDTPSTPEHND